MPYGKKRLARKKPTYRKKRRFFRKKRFATGKSRLQKMSWPVGRFVPPKLFAKTFYAYQAKDLNIAFGTSETFYILANGIAPVNDAGATTAGFPLQNVGSTGVTSGQSISNPLNVYSKMYGLMTALSAWAKVEFIGKSGTITGNDFPATLEITCVPWNFGDCELTPQLRLNQIANLTPEDLIRQRGAKSRVINTVGARTYAAFRCKSVSKKSFGVTNINDNLEQYSCRLNTGMSNAGINQVTNPKRQYGWSITVTNPSVEDCHCTLKITFGQNVMLTDPITDRQAIVINVPPTA